MVADEQHAKLVYGVDTSTYRRWLNSLTALGFNVTMADLWDLIPWSFVIDWFIPVGEMIDDTDDMFIQQRLPLKYIVLSRKLSSSYTREFQCGVHHYRASLNARDYVRSTATALPYDVWLRVELSDPRKQTLTATALLITLLIGKRKAKYLLH
jgi:hypothetical protein